jgi:hypothetical protein
VKTKLSQSLRHVMYDRQTGQANDIDVLQEKLGHSSSTGVYVSAMSTMPDFDIMASNVTDTSQSTIASSYSALP